MSQISTEENKTQYYGIMQGIFSTAIIPGNIISHFILKTDDTATAAAAAAAASGDGASSEGSGSDSAMAIGAESGESMTTRWVGSMLLNVTNNNSSNDSSSDSSISAEFAEVADEFVYPDPLKDMTAGWHPENSILFIVLALFGVVGTPILFFGVKEPDAKYGSKVGAASLRVGVPGDLVLWLWCWEAVNL